MDIRPATPKDLPDIDVVIQAVWNQSIQSETFLAHINDQTCAIHVALVNQQITGFVSGFLTINSGNLRRWEIDLLVVHPNHQGKGIGTHLILASTNTGHNHNVDLFRALVRANNPSSQSAFAKAGYKTNNQINQLHLWNPQSQETLPSIPEHITLLPMDTLTYRGLWIEGLTENLTTQQEQIGIVKAAQNIAHKENRINTGALIPIDEINNLHSDLRQTATLHGDYHWWIKHPTV